MNLTKTETECLVFRTNLQTKTDVKRIADVMNTHSGILEWSVDLEDWEKVLRVVGTSISSRQIISILRSLNVNIQEIPV